MPSYSPRPTDPGFSSFLPGVLSQEYQRGYQDGRAEGLRGCPIHWYPPPERKTGGDDMSTTKFLSGFFLGLFLGVLLGLFLGFFIVAKFSV